MTQQAWLTSADHYFWNTPRRVSVTDVRLGPEPGSEYARLDVGADQPDGPMTLLARPRHSDIWVLPEPGAVLRVMVWRVSDPEQVWSSKRVKPPTPAGSAWCSLTVSEADALRVGGAG